MTDPSSIEMAHDPEVSGYLALTHHTTRGAVEPNEQLNGMPFLHGTLRAIRTPLWQRPVAHLLGPTVSYPRHFSLKPPFPDEDIDPRERLAAWLIAEGADPWEKDTEGMDALDLAIQVGSVALFEALLRHPDCPERATLWVRTTPTEEGHLPWAHAAVNREDWQFLDALSRVMDSGRDGHGWLPAAWARQPSSIAALRSRGRLPSQGKDLDDVQAAWRVRGERQVIDVEGMMAACDPSYSPSDPSQQKAEWTERMATWLARQPMAKGSVKPLPLARTPQARAFRLTGTRGAAQGTWSMPGAHMAAVLTRDGSAAVTAKHPGHSLRNMDDWWTGAPDEEVETWLDEAVRPGLTNRGMAALLVLLDGMPDGGWNGPNMARRVVERPDDALRAAIDASLAMAAASPERGNLHVQQWTHILENLSAQGAQPLAMHATQALGEWGRVVAGPGLTWEHKTIQTLFGMARKGMADAANGQAFLLARALVNLKEDTLRPSTKRSFIQNLLPEPLAEQHLAERGRLLVAMAKQHRDSPMVGPWFEQETFSEGDLARMKKTEPGLAEEVRHIQLTHLFEIALPDASNGKSLRVRL